MKSSRRLSAWLFAAPYLLLFAVFLVYPLLDGLRLSFFRQEMLSTAPPRFIGFANYAEAFSDPQFWQALVATVKMVLAVLPPTIVLALLVAVGISRLPANRQSFYRAAYFLSSMLTVSVVAILWRWFYNPDMGLLRFPGFSPPWLSNVNWAIAAIALMTVWWTLGGPMVTLLAGLQGIPDHYAEAAQIDGATDSQIFWRITLPLLRPVLIFTVVLGIIGAFQIFGQPFLLTRGGPERATRSLSHLIYDTAFQNYRMGYAAALSWLLFLLIAGFSLIQFRLMREER